MDEIVAVGVPRAAGNGEFDLWLPVYVMLAFVLIWLVAGLRPSLRTAIAALAGGTVWSSFVDAIGVLPAAAMAVLVAFSAGVVARRRARPRPELD